MRRVFIISVLSLSLIYSVTTVFAAEPLASLVIDITRSSIEDLLTIKVTTASKKPQSFSHTPAAVYILTSSDIRRSGATSIPEVLRLVPGVQVARVDANKWAVSIRGFNARAANKLLVLIDGRSIYDPLFTGVIWEAKDVMLEDVERIEVVRGPGGSLWGANAVNGVINIITRPAHATLGGLAAIGTGTEEKGIVNLRYGLNLTEGHALRLYTKYHQRDSSFVAGDSDPDDDSRFSQFGFRYDGRLNDQDIVTLQADAFNGEQNPPNVLISPETETVGANLLGRWTRELMGGNQISLQFYYDETDYDFGILEEERQTFDIQFQHLLSQQGAHYLIWGASYRKTWDEIQNTALLMLQPDSREDALSGVFVQDDIELLADKLILTMGTKFEFNDYTGSNTQPNIRLAWHISDSNLLWAAASKAVRTPSRLEHDIVVPFGGGLEFAGARNMQNEELTAYEIGTRFQASKTVLVDVVAFVNQYKSLLTVEGLTFANKSSGSTRGAEATVTYILSDNWKWVAGYSYLNMDLKLDADSLDNPVTRTTAIEGNNPERQAFMQLSFDPTPRHEFDIAFRYVGKLPTQMVDRYLVADLRLAVLISDNLQFSLVGQNQLESHHAEQSSSMLASEVEDGWYAKLQYAF